MARLLPVKQRIGDRIDTHASHFDLPSTQGPGEDVYVGEYKMSTCPWLLIVPCL